MRALVFLLKLLLKILVAPVILTLTLFVWICVGIVYVSGLVLGLISMVIALLGAAVLLTCSLQNGIILLKACAQQDDDERPGEQLPGRECDLCPVEGISDAAIGQADDLGGHTALPADAQRHAAPLPEGWQNGGQPDGFDPPGQRQVEHLCHFQHPSEIAATPSISGDFSSKQNASSNRLSPANCRISPRSYVRISNPVSFATLSVSGRKNGCAVFNWQPYGFKM